MIYDVFNRLVVMYMTEDGRNVAPYRGFLFSCLLLIAIPVIFYYIVYGVIIKYQSQLSKEMQISCAMMFGMGAGCLFNYSCVILGLFKGTFKVVVKRIVNFISNISISPKIAIMCYKTDLEEDGAVFWAYFFIIVFFTVLFIIGLSNCIEFYINY